MSKRMLVLVAAIAAIAVLSITLFKFGKSKELIRKADPAFGEYISGYTSGVISSGSTIRVLLVNESEKAEESGKPVESELFSFSPSIKGTTVWVDKRTIEFRPEQKLPAGQVYDASFKLSKVVEVKDGLGEFEFGFQVMQQSFEVYVDGMTTTDRTTLRLQRLNGTLSTADNAEDKSVEQVLSATQGGKKLHVKWEHQGDGTTHRFSIDSIRRSEKPDSVQLKWNGSPLGVDISSGRSVEVPALGDFKVMDVKVVNDPEQYAALQFSDPLQEQQTIEGLVTLTGSYGLKYLVEGNELRVYPSSRISGEKTIAVETGVKNILGMPLKAKYSMNIIFEELKPAIKLMGKGVILPSSNGLIFPFQAVSLRAVDVKIIKIFENNIPQFLQVNNYDGSRELKRVGRTVLKKTVKLKAKSALDFTKWNTYSLDLAELVKAEPGAIYKVILSFKRNYSTYRCDNASDTEKPILEEVGEKEDDDDSNWDYYSDYYYDDYSYGGGEEYDEDYYEYDYNERYRNRDNPCTPFYYTRNRDVSRNVIASDLGLIAKRGTSGAMSFIVTDLKSTQPVSGTSIDVYDFQQQLISTVKTNGEGMANVDLKKKPFLLVAKNGKQRGYLKLDDGSSLSLSMFDVSGESVEKGLKGFIYGERGVWRPGDTLFLSFILEDEEKTLPKNHPVSFELLNPQGQVLRKMVRTSSLNGFYNFTTTTEKESPTGFWTARIKVGGVTFSKSIQVETIMPNRLKLNLDFGVEQLSVANKDLKGILNVKWLSGAIAKNLNTKVDVVLNQTSTSFPKYEKYRFDDPSRNFYSESQTLFDGKINEKGQAEIVPELNTSSAAPGMLRAFFTVRVFEEGGNFSIDRFSLPYSPYSNYVGMQIPETGNYSNTLVTDTNHIINIATVDDKGKPVSRTGLKVQVYKVNWRWWWDSYDGDLANYVGNTYHQPYYSTTINTSNGKGQFTLRVNRPEWGRFFIRVTDEESGHSTGETVYIDWPSWAGSSPKGNEGATLLSFTSDKQKYNVGEKVKLTIPTGAEGRALVSIETGSKVLEAHWVTVKPASAKASAGKGEAPKGETTFEFPVTAEMAPNVYVHVSLIQPHSQAKNDLPIRLYGVIPVSVEDPMTHLRPVIKTADVWKPEEKASVTVSEETGKEMTYTIAVVDEGLLDITKFKTPDPWSYFYAKEALGVKTWDLFDMVMGAYGGELERILAIGGDGEGGGKDGNKANRFKPMVRFFGPLHIGKGETKTTNFIMPNYVGSVRVMVIAGQNLAYGSSDKTVPVRKPLMVLATLPRVVGPGETVDLPVTIFAMEKHVKNVNVEIKANEFFTVEGGNKQSLNFKEIGDEVLNFHLKVRSKLGVGKVKVVATSGNEKSSYDIEIDVRNPNPKVVNVVEAVIEPGQSWTGDYTPPGMEGTNKGTLELSVIPPINLGERLKYLIEYPHGCVEQTTSSVFPQLFLSDIMELNSDFKIAIDKNIKAGIQRLKGFQLPGGGFSYWPGAYEADDWGSTYAGHFMLEAELKGYALPPGFLDNWKRYQKQRAVAWSPARYGSRYYYYYNDGLEQAYRLYTLALAKAPELGAMNRLKEYSKLSLSGKWTLAAAYAMAGQKETAKKLIENVPTKINRYCEMGWTYGSSDRDIAMILQTLTLLDEKAKGATVLKEISTSLSSNQWMSTQTTAYCLIAVSKFAKMGGASKEIMCSYAINSSGSTTFNGKMPLKQVDMALKNSVSAGKVEVKNNGKGILFARIITEGIPEAGDQSSVESDLKLSINYTKMDGSELDPTKLTQGTDFIAEVTVSNPGTRGEYLQMALSQVFPSGWEIHNTRMDEGALPVKSDYPTYQDIRDDRVYTYFDLSPARSKTYRIILNAAYVGRFYLPTVYCEAMYDNTINARKPGRWVEVVRAGEIN